MKKITGSILAATLVLSLLLMSACAGGGDTIVREKDERGLTAFEYTEANLTATDKVGRIAPAGDLENGNDVGIFYHNWLGVYQTQGKVLDLTKILAEIPDYLSSDYLDMNAGLSHFWGEPLYGYYRSEDPYIITRHAEILMAMGIDFVVFDYTNNMAYDTQADAIFEIWQTFYDQGFRVPKVTFYTNTGSANVICHLYHRYYEKGLYKDLWYAPHGKPLIIGVRADTVSEENREVFNMLKEDFFDFRESQWPNWTTVKDYETGFPWMSWDYPQKNYNGMMNVSLAQHPGAQMSAGPLSNNGRGYDYTKNRNNSANTELGTNYEGQWKTVHDNNADPSKQPITQVMITGFNEWAAGKSNDGENSFFLDTFSEEYSRDVEMMKGGYDDNYVIQTLTNTRRYQYSAPKHYEYSLNTMPLDAFSAQAWENIKSEYRDMRGDAIARNHADAFGTMMYVDNSNRNDIVSVKVTHDAENLYVRVETADDITAYNGTDKNWMTLFLKTEDGNENSFGGFQYVVNRSPDGSGKTSFEKSKGGYEWESAGEAAYAVSGNVILYRVPLAPMGLSAENCYVRLKVSDNVTKYDDIMDYYVTGDSAPIGRFAYAYGY